MGCGAGAACKGCVGGSEEESQGMTVNSSQRLHCVYGHW